MICYVENNKYNVTFNKNITCTLSTNNNNKNNNMTKEFNQIMNQNNKSI